VLSRIPLVAVSALAMVGDRDRLIGSGFDGYISKPIDPQRFVADLEAFLPAARRGEAARSTDGDAVQPTAHPSRNTYVLVVDDIASNRELMREILEPLGFEVRTAERVSQALALAAERPPDLILTDLHMPGADGFELIRALKADATLATVPLMVLSSSTWNARERELALELGVARFLTRPIEPDRLVEQLDRCLARRA
jgi:two-component system cell cycle response regulator